MSTEAAGVGVEMSAAAGGQALRPRRRAIDPTPTLSHLPSEAVQGGGA
jgi:hypothetical protein